MDNFTLYLVAIAIGIVAIGNIVVNYMLFKSYFYSTIQKIIQTLIIWLFPILGMMFVWHFLKDELPKGNKENGSDWSSGGITDCSDSSSCGGGGE